MGNLTCAARELRPDRSHVFGELTPVHVRCGQFGRCQPEAIRIRGREENAVPFPGEGGGGQGGQQS